MTTPREAVEVHVWFDEGLADLFPTKRYWAISAIDHRGEEVIQIGGGTTLFEAWDRGCEAAKELGVPCVEYDESGEISDRWEPDA